MINKSNAHKKDNRINNSIKLKYIGCSQMQLDQY